MSKGEISNRSTGAAVALAKLVQAILATAAVPTGSTDLTAASAPAATDEAASVSVDMDQMIKEQLLHTRKKLLHGMKTSINPTGNNNSCGSIAYHAEFII